MLQLSKQLLVTFLVLTTAAGSTDYLLDLLRLLKIFRKMKHSREGRVLRQDITTSLMWKLKQHPLRHLQIYKASYRLLLSLAGSQSCTCHIYSFVVKIRLPDRRIRQVMYFNL